MLVLTYHSVRDGLPGNPFVTPPREFESQLRALSGRYRFLDPRGLDPAALPDDGALLTFDDGYEDNFAVAMPIALGLGIPMAVFPATRFIGKSMRLGGSDLPCLSASQIRDMDATGMVAFGSHTHGHVFLDEVEDREAFAADLRESKDTLAGILGSEPDMFVYPKGRYNAALRPILEASFRMAFRGGGLARGGCDPLQIPRVELLSGDRWHVRELKLRGLYYAWRKMRDRTGRRKVAATAAA